MLSIDWTIAFLTTFFGLWLAKFVDAQPAEMEGWLYSHFHCDFFSRYLDGVFLNFKTYGDPSNLFIDFWLNCMVVKDSQLISILWNLLRLALQRSIWLVFEKCSEWAWNECVICSCWYTVLNMSIRLGLLHTLLRFSISLLSFLACYINFGERCI